MKITCEGLVLVDAVPTSTDINARKPYPGWSDPIWNQHRRGHVVYGDENAPAQKDAYEDRMHQWNADAFNKAHEARRGDNTFKSIETFLSVYSGKPCKLVSARFGVRPDNGYPWYYYRWNEESE